MPPPGGGGGSAACFAKRSVRNKLYYRVGVKENTGLVWRQRIMRALCLASLLQNLSPPSCVPPWSGLSGRPDWSLQAGTGSMQGITQGGDMAWCCAVGSVVWEEGAVLGWEGGESFIFQSVMLIQSVMPANIG